MAAGASSEDPNYTVCVALASDSLEVVKLFQREFGDALVHVDGPVVHIDRRLVAAALLFGMTICVLFVRSMPNSVTLLRPSQ
jgi:hypothetical protein